MNYTAIPNDRQDQATTENNRHIRNGPKVYPSRPGTWRLALS